MELDGETAAIVIGDAMTQDTAGTVTVQTASADESINVTTAMISTTSTSAHVQPL
jgi:hypothetical protein